MKPMQIYAFDMNCVGHINHGLWTHPRDTSLSYTDLDYWVDFALTAERGKLDGIFLADIVGVYDVYKGSPETSILLYRMSHVGAGQTMPVVGRQTNHVEAISMVGDWIRQLPQPRCPP